MIISVFGASGRLGQAFIRVAADVGLVQRLHYRTVPEGESPELSTVVVGALNDPTAVREVLRGAETAVVLFGHRDKEARKFAGASTKAIIAGMRTQGVSRLVCVTDAMVGALPRNVSLDLKLKAFYLRKTGWEDVLNDRDDQERLVRNSKLSWTVVKPSRLSNGPSTDAVDAGPSVSMTMLSGISRDSLARFLVREVMQPKFPESAVYVRER